VLSAAHQSHQQSVNVISRGEKRSLIVRVTIKAKISKLASRVSELGGWCFSRVAVH
jgi:hypothetical protein